MKLIPEIERLAELIAARTGKTVEEVIREAVEAQARLAGVHIDEPPAASRAIDLARVREITRSVASRPLRDKRTPKEILDRAWGQA